MQQLDRLFILAGFAWLMFGMAFGIWLGIADQLNFGNSHAHANLVGFTLSVLFGLLHRSWPTLRRSRLAVPQFWIYEIGAIMLVFGKAMVDAGNPPSAILKIGALVVLTGALLFMLMFARHEADKA